jgi:hypothetical protein
MQVVQKASKAAYGLCQWARAMEAYDRVAKVGTSHSGCMILAY